MFDLIFSKFGAIAVGIIAFVGLIIGGLYVTMQTETSEYDTTIETGTTSLPTP